MLQRTQKYDINVIYVKGKHMYIAYMLSRSYLTDENLQTDFEHINMVSFFLPIRDEILTQMPRATDQDEVWDQLKKTMTQSRSTCKTDLSTTVSWSSRGVVTNVLDFEIVVTEFKLHSR